MPLHAPVRWYAYVPRRSRTFQDVLVEEFSARETGV
jgi:hypothetical protein